MGYFFSRQPLGATTLLLAAVLVLYRTVVPEWISDLWADPNYSHGLLVPLVSLWLAHERREELSDLRPAPATSAIVLLLAGLALFAVGLVAAELFTTRLSLIVLLIGLLAFILGYQYVYVLAAPLGFLLFMIPLPNLVFNAIAFPLQLLASQFAVAVLHAISVPALREGNVILLPNGALEIVEACSGLRSLVSLAATSVVLALLSLHGIFLRSLLIASSVPIAVLANGARVSGTGVLAYHYGPEIAEGFFHGFSGWVVFVVALGFLGLLALALRRLQSR